MIMASHTQRVCTACRHHVHRQTPYPAIPYKQPFRAPRHAPFSTFTSATTSPRSIYTKSPVANLSQPTNHKRIATYSPPSQHRQLSTSARLSRVLQNPRYDDEGKEMVLQITPRASNRLKQISTKESTPQYLRINVESGGCHGFQYLMSLLNPEQVNAEEDTVIEAEDGTGAKIVLDEPSLELLKGSKVDYTMELIGSQFKIVDNPAASSSCGCGTSFDVKVL